MTHAEFAQHCRDLADFVESHPELPEIHQGINVNCSVGQPDAREKLAQIAKLLGTCSKVGYGDYLWLAKQFGPFSLNIMVERVEVCTRKVVGREQVPEQLIPAHEREIVEWECESIFAPASASATDAVEACYNAAQRAASEVL